MTSEIHMDLDLRGKSFVVTGATSGIGRALSTHLDFLGCRVLMVGRSKEKLDSVAKDLSANTTVFAIDLTVTDQLWRLESVLPSRVDGFVHSAGIESVEPLNLVNYQKFDSVMRLHVYSFVEIMRLIALRKPRRADYTTSVVALSSIAAEAGGIGQTMYAASKAALDAVVRSLSKELANKKIRLNAIKPGIVDTEMTRRWMDRIGIDDILDVEKMQVNGLAKPADIVNLILFLLSNFSQHITGAHIKIDGGGPSGKIF